MSVRPSVGTSVRPSTKSLSVFNEMWCVHSYVLNQSPCGLKRKYDAMLETRQQQCSRLKSVCRKLLRQQKKLKDKRDIIKQLKVCKDMNEDAVRVTEDCFGSIPAEMLRRASCWVRRTHCTVMSYVHLQWRCIFIVQRYTVLFHILSVRHCRILQLCRGIAQPSMVNLVLQHKHLRFEYCLTQPLSFYLVWTFRAWASRCWSSSTFLLESAIHILRALTERQSPVGPIMRVSEWVSSFLTAHQHIIGHSVP